MAVVGSAEIVVRAITTKVRSDIEKAFKDMRPTIAAEGRRAGKDFAGAFGQTLNQRLEPEMKKALQNATNSIDKDLTRDLSQSARKAGAAAGDELENELTKAGGRGGRGAGSSFASVFGKDLSGAISKITNLASVIDIMGPAIANLVAGLSSAVSGLFAMAAAASQAAGALAVLPGLFSVVAQAFGAIKLASGGIGEAIKLGTKAQTAALAPATKYAATQAAAAKKVTEANKALRDSQKELTKTQDILNAAREKAAGAADDQKTSEGLLANAKKNLSDVLADPSATAGQKADAQKLVDEATKSSAQATVAKIAQAKKVQAAENAVANAQTKNDKAQKAKNAADKAAKAGGVQSPAVKAADAYQAALARLSPAARAFVEEIFKMKAAFKEVGNTIAGQFFPPLTKALQLIGKSKLFDILKKELGTTGKLLGNTGLNFAKAFTAPRNLGAFQKILQGNNKIIGVLTTSMKDLGGNAGDTATPVDHLVHLLLTLGQAIQPITKRFVTWASGLVASADGAAKLGKHGNGLLGFFKRAGDRAAQLGRIFRNLFHILGDLSKAALPAGDGLLKSFQKATKKLHEFLETPKQQKILKKFFDDAATNFRAISDLIVVIGDEFLSLGDNAGIKSFADSLSDAARKFGDLADKLTSKEVGEASGDLFGGIADLLNQLTQSGQMEVFLKTLTGIVKVFTLLAAGFNKLPFAGLLLGIIAVNRAFSFSAKILGFSKSLTKLKDVLIKTPLKAFARQLGNVVGKIPGLSKIGDKLKSVGVPKQTGGTGDARAQGQSVGHAIADGIAEGIGEHSALVIQAIDGMVDELIQAVKTRLGISSRSKVMSRYGEDTGEGFVLGIKEETANAFKAGEGLAAAAADGARAGSAGAVGAGRAEGRVAATASAAAGPAVLPVASGLGKAEKAAAGTATRFGKLGGASSKLGGGIKALSGGLMALTGGPFGLLLIALPLLIAGFVKLYKKSPEFRKFVDTIVKAIKPLIKWLGEVLLKVLNAFFKWVNNNLPKIGKVFAKIFGGIVKALTPVFNFIKDHWVLIGTILIGPIVLVVSLIIKHFDTIKSVITSVIGFVVNFVKDHWGLLLAIFGGPIGLMVALVIKNFDKIKTVISKVFHGISVVWNKVLRPVFGAIKSVVGTVGRSIGRAFNGAGKIFDGFKAALDTVLTKVRAIVDGIKGAFGEIKGAVSGAFGGLWDAVKGVLGTFVGLVNDKLIDGVNAVITKFGVPGIKHIPGFAEGGYTGSGAKYQVAGLVHADEFVVKKSSRRAIESTHPGFLDALNKTGKIGTGGGFGFPDVHLGKLKDLAGDTIGGIKDIGTAIAKKGVGKVLETIIKGAEGLMGGSGIKRGKLITDFLYGIMDSIAAAAKGWGGAKGKQPGGVIADVGGYTGPPSGWVSPLRGRYPITQYANSGHNPPWAIDIGAPSGSQVQAASSGIVVINSDLGTRSYGKYIQIAHADGISSLYAHLSASLINIGKKVLTGQLIGVSGNTGHSTGPHLHFEIKPGHDTLEELRKRGVRLASGGIARATSGGIPALIAEAGKNERVEPLDDKGMSKRDKEMLRLIRDARGGGLVVHVHNPRPERASESVSTVLRRRGFDKGWRG